MKRTIIIGDIHGCLHEFKDLVDKLGVSTNDRVVCLGDFMDKGPFPTECVSFARKNSFESILGNHEEWHLRWRKWEDKREREIIEFGSPKTVNPMKMKYQKDVEDNKKLCDDDIEWLSKLPSILELTNGFFAVHGGVQPGLPLSLQDPKITIRARWFDDNNKHIPVNYDSESKIGDKNVHHWSDRWGGPESIVYGHEAFSLEDPKINNYDDYLCVGVDTGVVHGGKLTALVLPDVKFVQISAREVYLPL